jgi:hypothetical protein
MNLVRNLEGTFNVPVLIEVSDHPGFPLLYLNEFLESVIPAPQPPLVSFTKHVTDINLWSFLSLFSFVGWVRHFGQSCKGASSTF